MAVYVAVTCVTDKGLAGEGLAQARGLATEEEVEDGVWHCNDFFFSFFGIVKVKKKYCGDFCDSKW